MDETWAFWEALIAAVHQRRKTLPHALSYTNAAIFSRYENDAKCRGILLSWVRGSGWRSF